MGKNPPVRVITLFFTYLMVMDAERKGHNRENEIPVPRVKSADGIIETGGRRKQIAAPGQSRGKKEKMADDLCCCFHKETSHTGENETSFAGRSSMGGILKKDDLLAALGEADQAPYGNQRIG